MSEVKALTIVCGGRNIVTPWKASKEALSQNYINEDDGRTHMTACNGPTSPNGHKGTSTRHRHPRHKGTPRRGTTAPEGLVFKPR